MTSLPFADVPVADPHAALLPGRAPVRFVDSEGHLAGDPTRPRPAPALLHELYRRMVVGRRFDQQATALTKQGRLAVYPSSHGRRPARSARCSRCVPPTGSSRRTGRASRW